MEERACDVAVIGGGPAGTAAAITAARGGARVLLLERGRVPRHKVCGEFVSPESLRLLAALLREDPLLDQAPRITQARLFLGSASLKAELSPPAAAITRHDLDLALWRAAERAGVECCQGTTVQGAASAGGEGFWLSVLDSTSEHAASYSVHATSVIDASGRWSNLQAERRVPKETWVGLKAHFDTAEACNSVDLYFFPQGYCGVQPIGLGKWNACAMVRAATGVGNSLERVFALHPELWRRSRDWSPVIETVATAPLFFRDPRPQRESVLLAGDSAGFIDPFVGDGISMALQSGLLAAQCLLSHGWSSEAAARTYANEYREHFMPVFRSAARVRRFLTLREPLRGGILALARVPGVAEYLLRSTRLQFPIAGA